MLLPSLPSLLPSVISQSSKLIKAHQQHLERVNAYSCCVYAQIITILIFSLRVIFASRENLFYKKSQSEKSREKSRKKIRAFFYIKACNNWIKTELRRSPKNSLRTQKTHFEKIAESEKRQEKFEKNSRKIRELFFKTMNVVKNTVGTRLTANISQYSLCIRSTLSCSWTAKNALCIILRLLTQREKNSHQEIARDYKRLRHQGKSEGVEQEWSRSGAVESTEWAQSADRTSCIPSALLSWTPLLLSCSLEFFLLFYIPNGYWSRTSFFRT